MYNKCVPDYRYECVDRAGKVQKGKLTADSREGAVIALRERGLIPTSVREIQSVRPAAAPGLGSVTVQRLGVFTRKFAELISTDIPLSEVFEILAEEEEGTLLPEACRHVAKEVAKGNYLIHAMAERPRVFSPLYIKMVEAGMRSGTLDKVADNLARIYEAETALRKRFISKLIYPAIILGVAFLSAFVLRAIGFVRNELFMALMGFWLVMGGLAVFGITRIGYSIYRQIGFRLPGIGKLMRNINLARFCRILGLQYGAGVPILEGLEVSKETLQDPTLQRAVTGIQRRINSGMDIREAMAAVGVFPRRVVTMVGVGERAGGVEQMLAKLAEYYDLDVETGSTILTTIIFFVVFFMVAITVGIIVISAWSSYWGLIGEFMPD
jgi:type IV pilus assembly protein PilC